MLLKIPYDVRRKIYDHIVPSSVHIWTTAGVTRVFSCVPPPATDPKEPGKECQEGLPLEEDKWDESHTKTWAVRLQSGWGPHWKCEEKAKELADYSDITEVLLRVNKHINAEIVDLIVTSTEVIITDIASFETLVRRSVDVKFSCRFKDVQKLRIIAKLHTRALTTIEQRNQISTRESTRETTQKNDDAEVVAWQRLSFTLAHVTALRTLRVWLDRRESYYWTTVDESAILAPLRPLAVERQLDVCIELPRHYNDNITTFPFKVTRRLRQRFFGYIDLPDEVRTFRKADFPMIEACHFPVDGLSAAELESAERQLWREGVNIQHDIINDGYFICRGNF
ncbi:hypothetical protein BKA63DRAFT_106645 [Paraphoma chrysanthemicola]|nr:hypothetical protein BKA63DRAFT_106645 [Paraphoma chrysanthemicola]